MNVPAAHNRSWQTSEVVFGIPLLAGIAVDFFKPFSITSDWLSSLLIGTGVLLMVAGAACIFYARRELAAHNQPTDPGKPTTQIVTTGIYTLSRNPLYLGAAVLMLGVALVLNSWWIVIAFFLALVLCHLILIIPEERYLAGKLGGDYEAYRQMVNRWIGRKQLRR
jgi:protein-S-isoprenylcysteine O-methyltransferase Ste14